MRLSRDKVNVLARAVSDGDSDPSERDANDFPNAAKSRPCTRSTVTCMLLPTPETPSSLPWPSTRACIGPSTPSTIVMESGPRAVAVTSSGSVSPSCTMAMA